MKPWQKVLLRCVALLVGLGPSLPGLLWAEDVSVTAYYPSPRGVYEELRSSNNTYLATTGGSVGIGTSDPQDVFHVAVDAAVGRRDMLYTVAGNVGGTDHPRLRLQRARNTIASPLAVQFNDDLAAIRFDGWDGANYNAGARLEAEVDGVVGLGSIPGRLMFATGAVGVAAPVERMRIDSQGRVGIGTATPRGRLDVDGLVFIGHGDDLVGLDLGTVGSTLTLANTDHAFFLPTFTTASTPEDSDLRLYIEDNPLDQFSIWGDSCSAGDCQNLDFSRKAHAFRANGNVYHRGRLGVGTEAPEGLLHVYNEDGIAQLFFTTINDVGHTRMIFQKARAGKTAVQLNDPLGVIRFTGYDGTDYDMSARIRAEVDGVAGGDVLGRLLFFTFGAGDPFGGTERLRIDSNGNIGIGTTTPAALLHLKGGPVAGVSNARIILENDLGDQWFLNTFSTAPSRFSIGRVGVADDLVINENGKVGIGTGAPTEALHVVGNVQVDGNITATGTVTGSNIPSDSRLKTAVVPLAGVLEKVESLQAISYQWNETAKRMGYDPARPQIGVIAQEVEAVFPELVTLGANGYRSVDYGRLSAVLLEAIKELKAQSEALKARVKALEQEHVSTQPLP